jgi:hypothetical protein
MRKRCSPKRAVFVPGVLGGKMRKRFRILVLAAVVAAVVVPVGFALSLDSGLVAPELPPTTAIVASSSAAPLIVTSRATGIPLLGNVPDGAKLFAVGVLLIGIAAAVRKAP